MKALSIEKMEKTEGGDIPLTTKGAKYLGGQFLL